MLIRRQAPSKPAEALQKLIDPFADALWLRDYLPAEEASDMALLKYAADIENYKQRTAAPMINIVEKLKALGDGEPQFRASVLASREGLSRYLAGAEG